MCFIFVLLPAVAPAQLNVGLVVSDAEPSGASFNRVSSGESAGGC